MFQILCYTLWKLLVRKYQFLGGGGGFREIFFFFLCVFFGGGL